MSMWNPKRLSKRQTRRIVWSYVFLTPQLVLYLTLTILPLVLAMPLLFTDRVNYTDIDWEYIGAGNFKELAQDDSIRGIYLSALGRTARFTVMNYAMVYLFGLGLALLMYEVGFRGGLFSVIYLPYMLSGLALGYMAVMLFSETTGTVNLLLLKLGLIQHPFSIKKPEGTLIALPIMMGWRWAGFYMAIFLAGLLSIPTETIEAAIVDGASYFQRLFRVYFPQMMPSFIIATIFALFNSFNIFDELVALGAMDYNTAAEFLSIVVFKFGFSANRLAMGMTMAVVAFVPLLILSILLQRLQQRLQYYD
jgi:ABC-type sugar transport system permease subunit